MFSFKKDTTLCVLFFLSMLLSTCAGKVEGPAECPIDCSNAINATMSTEIEPLVEEVNVYCHGSTVPKVIELLFLFVDSVENVGIVPRPSISFRPVFNGSYDPSRNHQEEVEYKGIETPKDKWCSSTCGVAKINIWPQCEEGVTLEHQFYLTSGSIISPEVMINAIDQDGEGGG